MAHAHDRTLLASLAFGDPDKKDPLHDLACQYVAQPSVVNAMGLVFEGVPVSFAADRSAELEHPISKGVNQYKTTIGFTDVLVPVCAPSSFDGWTPHPDNKDFYFKGTEVKSKADLASSLTTKYCGHVLVEVKINPVGLGDVLRQINLYREYVCARPLYTDYFVRYECLLVTAFDMTAVFEEGLCEHQITPFHLGDGFKAFVEAQRHSVRPGTAKTI